MSQPGMRVGPSPQPRQSQMTLSLEFGGTLQLMMQKLAFQPFLCDNRQVT